MSGGRKPPNMKESGNRAFRFRLIFGQDGQSISIYPSKPDVLASTAAHGCAAMSGGRKPPNMKESGNRAFRFRLIFGQDGQ
jgi:hypothetical protein